MATTTNYGWETPDVGADNDTWGTILNAAFADIDAQMAANALTVDTETLKVDNTNNRVGVNIASPEVSLDTRASTVTKSWAHGFTTVANFERDGNVVVQLTTGLDDLGLIQFGDDAARDSGQLRYDHATNIFSVQVGGSADRVTLDASGNAAFAGAVDTGDSSTTLDNLGFSANAKSLVAAADYAAMRTLMSVYSTADADAAFQPKDSDLTAIAGLAKTDGSFIVGNGTTWVAESGATARASLGAQAQSAALDTYAANSLTAAELAQLQNIGSNAISATEWGRVAALGTAAIVNLAIQSTAPSSPATNDLWLDTSA